MAVAHHNSKQALLSVAQRVHLLKRSAGHLANVRITSFEGLLVNFAREQGAQALIRGLRAVSDFEFEFQMALMNRSLQPELETLFLMPSEEYTYLSSRMVKEVSRLGGDVRRFVPECVVEALRDPESVKPGNKMAKAYRDNKITLSDEEQVALVAYLESLK